MEYRCNLCIKRYSSYQSLWIHNKKFHDSNSPKKSENSPKKSENSPKNYNCRYCKKYYYNKNSRWSHEQKCINNNKQIINNQNINNQNIQNNINNQQINNHQKQIIINQIGCESIDCLPIKDILKILSDGNNMPITCIKKLNFNKNIPQNHSFCTTTLEGKHFTRINHITQKPEKINKNDFIDEVLTSSLKFISNISFMTEFDDDYKNKIPIEYQNKMKYILDNQHKFADPKTKKAFFNCINDMSYNFKDIILETWKLIQPVDIIENVDSDEPPFIDVHFNYIDSSDDDN